MYSYLLGDMNISAGSVRVRAVDISFGNFLKMKNHRNLVEDRPNFSRGCYGVTPYPRHQRGGPREWHSGN